MDVDTWPILRVKYAVPIQEYEIFSPTDPVDQSLVSSYEYADVKAAKRTTKFM